MWAVVTDYDHLAEIMPDLRKSYCIGKRTGNKALIFQEGVTRVLGFPVGVAVTLAMEEAVESKGVRTIRFTLGKRNLLMESLDGEVRLEPTGRGGTRVSLTLALRARGPLSAFSAAIAEAEVPKRLGAVEHAVKQTERE